jgi:hypothetical protein
VCVCARARSAKCDYSDDRGYITIFLLGCSYIVKCMNVHFVKNDIIKLEELFRTVVIV